VEELNEYDYSAVTNVMMDFSKNKVAANANYQLNRLRDDTDILSSGKIFDFDNDGIA
jgi:hypothetical protein